LAHSALNGKSCTQRVESQFEIQASAESGRTSITRWTTALLNSTHANGVSADFLSLNC
jgi:hypothetical protein